ncbi:MAG TPA: hypothetical protein HA224_01170 [Nanoarchaeota archaeon]|nr:hypothetical protein [Nanoarchaeota archaeon]
MVLETLNKQTKRALLLIVTDQLNILKKVKTLYTSPNAINEVKGLLNSYNNLDREKALTLSQEKIITRRRGAEVAQILEEEIITLNGLKAIKALIDKILAQTWNTGKSELKGTALNGLKPKPLANAKRAMTKIMPSLKSASNTLAEIIKDLQKAISNKDAAKSVIKQEAAFKTDMAKLQKTLVKLFKAEQIIYNWELGMQRNRNWPNVLNPLKNISLEIETAINYLERLAKQANIIKTLLEYEA